MKEQLQFAMTVASMTAEDQKTFFNSVGNTGLFTKNEIESIQIVVGYLRLLKFPKMARALKEEMAGTMYQRFIAERKEKP